MMQDRRIGRFRIPWDLIVRRPAQARIILQDVLVLEADLKPWFDGIEYVGLHHAFAEVREGTLPPVYPLPKAVAQFPNGEVVVSHLSWDEAAKRGPLEREP